jgi:Transposase IS66 family
MELGSPFGARIAALVTTMRYGHGISYSRMQQMLGEVFGLEISEGAIANLFSRVKEQLQSEVTGIVHGSLQTKKAQSIDCAFFVFNSLILDSPVLDYGVWVDAVFGEPSIRFGAPAHGIDPTLGQYPLANGLDCSLSQTGDR